MRDSSLRRIILLVEDNVDDERLTVRALRKSSAGNQIVVARDGAQAVGYLFERLHLEGAEPGALPDLILLDLKLPKISGIEVLERIRATTETACIPVVVLTSSDEHQDVQQCYQLGANSYIRKPIDYEEFIKTVSQVEGYWFGMNQLPSPAVPT
jgi:two-component system, response regulator